MLRFVDVVWLSMERVIDSAKAKRERNASESGAERHWLQRGTRAERERSWSGATLVT